MSTISARCSSCSARVAVEPEQVVCAVPDRSGDKQAEMLFRCPGCGWTCLQLVPRALGVLLVGQGAASVPRFAGSGLVPAYPERRPEAGLPLDRDALLELHELLQTPDWFAGLQDADASTTGPEKEREGRGPAG